MKVGTKVKVVKSHSYTNLTGTVLRQIGSEAVEIEFDFRGNGTNGVDRVLTWCFCLSQLVAT